VFELTVVQGLVFCWWDVIERAVQAVLVPPFDPRQGGASTTRTSMAFRTSTVPTSPAPRRLNDSLA
jgi:hypothetical protein